MKEANSSQRLYLFNIHFDFANSHMFKTLLINYIDAQLSTKHDEEMELSACGVITDKNCKFKQIYGSRSIAYFQTRDRFISARQYRYCLTRKELRFQKWSPVELNARNATFGWIRKKRVRMLTSFLTKLKSVQPRCGEWNLFSFTLFCCWNWLSLVEP